MDPEGSCVFQAREHEMSDSVQHAQGMTSRSRARPVSGVLHKHIECRVGKQFEVGKVHAEVIGLPQRRSVLDRSLRPDYFQARRKDNTIRIIHGKWPLEWREVRDEG